MFTHVESFEVSPGPDLKDSAVHRTVSRDVAASTLRGGEGGGGTQSMLGRCGRKP